jgi:predicted  nucleic acid-binding Zn-ribbon protein
MIQLKCPRCGEVVSFGAADLVASCPKCQHSVQVQTAANRVRPAEPNKDRDITNAMLICGAIVLVSFGFPIVAGLFGEGAAKTCTVESTPVASVFDEEELLGQTPLQVPRYTTERELILKTDHFTTAKAIIPKVTDEVTECALRVTLLPAQ